MSNGSKDSSSKENLCDYTLKMSKQKGIRMRVTPQGEIVVHANPFCTPDAIERYISLHAGKLHFENKENIVRIFGKSFKIKEVKGTTNHVSTSEDELIIQYKENAQINEIYDNFLRNYAKEVFEDIAEMLMIRFKHYNFDKPEIKIRSMKKSWGICHKDYITLNFELVHYPVEFVEYVICHELVHMLEANHSSRFYDLLAKVMPDYKRRLDLIETSNKKQYLM